MRTSTATAQGAAAGASGDGEGPRDRAGLVLLYAEEYREIPRVLMLTGGVVVGREPGDSGVRLPLPAVSRTHARFTVDDGAWTVADLGSRNGTYVNRVRVAAGSPSSLVDGDHVRIGDAIFKFLEHGADLHLPFPLDGGVASGSADEAPVLRGGLAIDLVLALVHRVGKTTLSVLVHGETGTGKELVAGAIHRASGRRGKLSAVNCAALPAGLIESELFGVRRGAFTGATHDRQGYVRAAHGGTLMLDEIGDMPLETQAKLLRVLERREVVPVGASEPEKVDIRLVSATHRDLRQLVLDGKFRGDLFARINACVVELSPLRARKEDIFLLARHFAALAGRPDGPMTFQLVDALLAYGWPFNVRELEAAVRHAAAMAGDAALDVAHLPRAVVESSEAVDVGARDASPNRAMTMPPPRAASIPPPLPGAAPAGRPDGVALRALLARHGGNVAAVARELGKDRAQIHRWMRYEGIDVGDFR